MAASCLDAMITNKKVELVATWKTTRYWAKIVPYGEAFLHVPEKIFLMCNAKYSSEHGNSFFMCACVGKNCALICLLYCMTHKHCTLVFGSHYGWFYNDNFLWQPFKEWEITKWWDEWMPYGGILKTKHSCITMQLCLFWWSILSPFQVELLLKMPLSEPRWKDLMDNVMLAFI